MTTKMTITQALRELKLLANRIDKQLENDKYSHYFLPNQSVKDAKSPEEFDKIARSSYQSILDLINRRTLIKSKIVQSNAVTSITIGSSSMSVAAAIEFKTSIQNKKLLIHTLTQQRKRAELEQSKRMEQVDKDLIAMLSANTEMSVEDRELYSKSFRTSKEGTLAGIDFSIIEQLEKEVEAFESNVDTLLTISNSTTFIELD